MWSQKEKAKYREQLDRSRENLHRMYADEKPNEKAKEAFNRPLFGGLSNPRKEQNAEK